MRYTLDNTVAIGKNIKVFVNGNEINNVVIADTTRGEVIYYPTPLRLHKRKRDETYTRKLRGNVTVELEK